MFSYLKSFLDYFTELTSPNKSWYIKGRSIHINGNCKIINDKVYIDDIYVPELDGKQMMKYSLIVHGNLTISHKG